MQPSGMGLFSIHLIHLSFMSVSKAFPLHFHRYHLLPAGTSAVGGGGEALASHWWKGAPRPGFSARAVFLSC